MHEGAPRGLSVVHVVRQFAPSVGGLEDCVFNLARQQRSRQGLDARVVTLDRIFTDRSQTLKANDTVKGVPVQRLPWRGSSRYPLAPHALSAIRGADLVHVHGIDFFFDFLALTQGLHGKPLVASTHGGFFHTGFASGLKQIWFDRVTRRSMRAYDAVVACSAGDAALFERLAPRNLHTIENGVDIDKFPIGPVELRGRRRIVTFGRFASHKRIPALFDILARLLASEPGWELVVAGSASDMSAADLAAAATARGVGAQVRLRLAPSDAELAEELAAATWFACASAHEGFGIAAVEAASSGLIPVLSRIPPFAGLVDRLGDGLLFDPDAPDDAAAALLEPAPTADRHARIAMAARSYGWERAADAYSALYARVLAPAIDAHAA
jgi:alpha-1,3-mannosyltransferase